MSINAKAPATNKLKLGIFAANMDSGTTATKAPERYRITWPNVLNVTKRADDLGIEALLPMMRWKTMGGDTDFHASCYEPFTWAAGVAAVTHRTNVFVTMQVFAIHPVLAAKQMATIDHISNGRFGFNLVCGWVPAEFAMFGADMPDHDRRYAYAAEWLEIVERLWSSDEPFDYAGEFFQLRGVQMQPKPIRKPIIMNAGSSGVGVRFAAEHADMAFVGILESDTDQQLRAKTDEFRAVARNDFDKEIEIWGGAWVLCRETEEAAKAEYRRVLHELGDHAMLASLPPAVREPLKSLPPEQAKEAEVKLLAGFGTPHLVGTPEQIAAKLETLSSAGIDGVVLTFVDYDEGIRILGDRILPLLEARGLRSSSPTPAVA
jgi:alkanesulfonate monooxygenase SsuD/methylene tetrahydromethanopterin reductase-like flavin-dependent oxidoreductase (luciferase family)